MKSPGHHRSQEVRTWVNGDVTLRLRGLSRVAGAAAIVVGALTLVGWSFNVLWLTSILPGLATMKPNTAVAFVLAGVSLEFLWPEEPYRRGRVVAGLCALAVLLVGVLTLAEYAGGRHLGIDLWLFREATEAEGTSFPGRMAPATALAFALVGTALLLVHRGRIRAAQVPTLGAGFIGLLGVLGHAYGIKAFYGLAASYTTVAVNTAATFLLLAIGVLCARPTQGMMALLTSDTGGGVVARKLLLPAVVVPLFLAWVRLWGQRAGLYGTEFGLALFALSNILVFATLVAWNAGALHRTDRARRQANQALAKQTDRLEVLHKIDQDILTAQNPEAVAAAALHHLWNLVPYRRASFLRYDLEANEARALASHASNATPSLIPGTRFPLDTLGDIGDMLNALKQGKTYEQDMVKFSQHVPAVQAARAAGIRTTLVVPLLAEAQLIGALHFGLASTDVLTPEDLDIAREVADQVGIAIQQAELRQTVQRHTAELEQRVAARTEELGEATRFLEQLVATTPGVIYRRRPGDLAMTYVSGNVERVLGFRPEEIVGVPRFWYQRIHPDDRARLDADNERAWKERQPQVEREYRFRHPDGQYRWLQSVVRFEYDEAGALVDIVGFVLDVTDRKQIMEELARTSHELREARDSLETLVSMSPSIIFETDLKEGRVKYSSPNIERIVGYTREEIQVLSSWEEHIHPEDRQSFKTGMQEAISNKAAQFELEYRFQHKNGDPRWLHSVVRIAYDEGGRPTTVFGYSQDITLRKAAEETLRQVRLEADRANQAKSEFLSRMSHELRTPLNAILGFAQLLEMDSLNPEQSEGVAHILKGGRHLLGLINEVLDIARIEAGRLDLSLEAVSVDEVVRESLDLIAPLAAEGNIGAETAPASGFVLADRQRLKQVLLNLLSNAVKYNRRRGTVALSFENMPAGRLRIKVSDTGPGIAPERLERLFIPFERLGAEQSGVEGTGLGLALSKRLVEAMGGTLGVESMPGQGSTFWVELALAENPIQRVDQTGVALPAAAELNASRKARIVLYIEDNLSNLKLIQRLLAHRPEVRLIPAMQGRLGLDLAREHRPHLILLDLHLPDIPGEEVLQRLQADPETRPIPVVMVSADAIPSQVKRLRAEGARDYLTKPLDVKKFLALLDDVLADRALGPTGRKG